MSKTNITEDCDPHGVHYCMYRFTSTCLISGNGSWDDDDDNGGGSNDQGILRPSRALDPGSQIIKLLFPWWPPSLLIFLLSTWGGAVRQWSLEEELHMLSSFSWPCFQLKVPARRMPAACDQQPACSLRKLPWLGDVCRTHCILGEISARLQSWGIFFLISFTSNKTIISSTSCLASMSKTGYQLEINLAYGIVYGLATHE